MKVITGSDLPKDKLQDFLNVFSSIGVRILWKWETGATFDVPENVLLKKWLPQQDVLGHPNVRLFISHGGLGSTIESIYHGKPMVIMPGFADQFSIGDMAERMGLGLVLHWADLNEDSLR